MRRQVQRCAFELLIIRLLRQETRTANLTLYTARKVALEIRALFVTQLACLFLSSPKAAEQDRNAIKRIHTPCPCASDAHDLQAFKYGKTQPASVSLLVRSPKPVLHLVRVPRSFFRPTCGMQPTPNTARR